MATCCCLHARFPRDGGAWVFELFPPSSSFLGGGYHPSVEYGLCVGFGMVGVLLFPCVVSNSCVGSTGPGFVSTSPCESSDSPLPFLACALPMVWDSPVSDVGILCRDVRFGVVR